MKRFVLAAFLVILALTTWLLRNIFRPQPWPESPRTIDQVLDAIAPVVATRLQSSFSHSDISFPPARLALLAFKQEKRLDLYASNSTGPYRFICSYPILAASGTAGPKNREGDLQVPEGFYRIDSLNPNSRFHLALRVNYPNADDITRGAQEGRSIDSLGGDIMIHGSSISTGCLAMGDPVAEDLFVLAARTGLDNVRLIIAPVDFRSSAINAEERTAKLYRDLHAALAEFPRQETD